MVVEGRIVYQSSNYQLSVSNYQSLPKGTHHVHPHQNCRNWRGQRDLFAGPRQGFVSDAGLERQPGPLYGHRRRAAGDDRQALCALQRRAGLRSAHRDDGEPRGRAARRRLCDQYRRRAQPLPRRQSARDHRQARVLLQPGRERARRFLQPGADARRGARHGGNLPRRLADPIGQPRLHRLHADDARKATSTSSASATATTACSTSSTRSASTSATSTS